MRASYRGLNGAVTRAERPLPAWVGATLVALAFAGAMLL